ncbi:hypothetical protein [Neobacillus sp. FSL H8-0543]|uniref:hypothetical protein n=1 Tax=Neobacillus sp. FSL H8-0543 TaxID=2954672 RepID=UPI003158ED13
MIQKNTLHILNGQAMYDYYRETHFLEGEMMTPFNEAMCYGNTSNDLFSDEFIELRAKVHHVTPVQYIEHTLKPLQPLLSKNFTHISLWFDADMFCQINLLTLLAWLDRTNHNHPLDLHLVGDKFNLLESFTLEAKGYDALFKQVVIDKTMPSDIYPAILKQGVALYLNYLNEDSDLMRYIQKHQNLTEKELMLALLETYTHLGLGDTQYMEIIKDYRKKVKRE